MIGGYLILPIPKPTLDCETNSKIPFVVKVYLKEPNEKSTTICLIHMFSGLYKSRNCRSNPNNMSLGFMNPNPNPTNNIKFKLSTFFKFNLNIITINNPELKTRIKVLLGFYKWILLYNTLNIKGHILRVIYKKRSLQQMFLIKITNKTNQLKLNGNNVSHFLVMNVIK